MRPRSFFVVALLFLAVAAGSLPTQVRAERGWYVREERRVGDERPPVPIYELDIGLSAGAEAEVEVVATSNLDLDSSEDDDVVSVEPKFTFDLEYEPIDWLTGFVEFELSKLFLPRTPQGSETESTRLELKQAYVLLDEVLPSTSVQLGRTDFEDQRQWLYDEELDGARFFVDLDSVELELSATRLNWFERDLLRNDEDTRDEQVSNYFALAHFPHSEESRTSVYVLVRDDLESDGEDLVFTGVQSLGELTSSTDYWLDTSIVMGEDGPNDVLGFGIDVGATYVFDVPHEPALTLGIAFGTGDDEPDGNDGNFRQTGLQGNEGAFTGVATFQYYGEVLDPELSNLAIYTAGLGVRPSERTSVDVVYHYYHQIHAADELRDSGLEADPDGIHRDLGMGLDLVLGYLTEPGLGARLIFGWFFPGDAFPDDAANAYFAGFEAVWEF